MCLEGTAFIVYHEAFDLASSGAFLRSLHAVMEVCPKGRNSLMPAARTTGFTMETISCRANVDQEEPLDDHHVPPHAIQLGVLFVDTHLAKALRA